MTASSVVLPEMVPLTGAEANPRGRLIPKSAFGWRRCHAGCGGPRTIDEPPFELLLQQDKADHRLQADGRYREPPHLVEVEPRAGGEPNRERHENAEANRRAQHRRNRVAEPLEHAR